MAESQPAFALLRDVLLSIAHAIRIGTPSEQGPSKLTRGLPGNDMPSEESKWYTLASARHLLGARESMSVDSVGPQCREL
jgi:hypothetical protein